jgi:hypothetical protein
LILHKQQQLPVGQVFLLPDVSNLFLWVSVFIGLPLQVGGELMETGHGKNQ